MKFRRDIFAFYESQRVYDNRKSYAHLLYGKNILHRLRMAGKAVLNQVTAVWSKPKSVSGNLLRAKIWVYFNTKNQYDSLQFLRDGMRDIVFVSHEPTVRLFADSNVLILPLYASFPIRFLPNYLGVILGTLISNPGQFSRMFPYFFLGIGYFEVFQQFILRYRPCMIIMSNDHAVHCRAMMHAGNQAEIPTVFFQHASIKEDFPPMRFRYACLEGRDTLEKYRLIDPRSTTEYALVGMPKFDRYFSARNQKPSVKILGIPYGTSDLLEDIFELVEKIALGCSNLTIRIRPHPADRRTIDWSALENSGNVIEFSHPIKESAFEFLSSVDMVVAGNTSIHLEAILLNVVSIYFSRNREYDVYGYVKHGLVDAPDSYSEILSIIRANQRLKEEVRHRAKYYYAPLETDYDGQSGRLARKVVADILSKSETTC